jgi:CheY-like chemotaxis protein
MKKKILVVEDDKILQNVIKNTLIQAKFSVVTADDGEDALKKVILEKSDLVLLDLLMPKKTGWTVLKELKSDEGTKDIPVLVLTVHTDTESIAKCMALGAKGYFIKSEYTLDEIIEKINKILI